MAALLARQAAQVLRADGGPLLFHANNIAGVPAHEPALRRRPPRGIRSLLWRRRGRFVGGRPAASRSATRAGSSTAFRKHGRRRRHIQGWLLGATTSRSPTRPRTTATASDREDGRLQAAGTGYTAQQHQYPFSLADLQGGQGMPWHTLSGPPWRMELACAGCSCLSRLGLALTFPNERTDAAQKKKKDTEGRRCLLTAPDSLTRRGPTSNRPAPSHERSRTAGKKTRLPSAPDSLTQSRRLASRERPWVSSARSRRLYES
ncbi:hypothetical protein PVAP13_1NG481019 [Panicum virgatum]|uniref:Uncharacterized protein n=1 Tax=Panicum virgatum TaxID=38727 RepID=A0A8T0X481_PANVG|nr:hypothetical protein PVAP13_1NG481019 [Panicum virgatum]